MTRRRPDPMALLRLRYVKEYADRTGRVRRYFRRRGMPSVALPGEPGSRDFMAAYQAAMEAAPIRTARHGAGTFGSLVTAYYQAVEFANLKPSSQKLYRLVLDGMVETHGHRMTHDLPANKVRVILEAIGKTRPGMANLTRAILRRVMRFAVETGWRNDNPVAGIRPYKLLSRHTWTEAELAAYEARWPLGTRERLAYALLLYTGQRAGDVVRMRRSDISSGAIHVVQQKTGAELSITLHAALLTAIKAGPSKGIYLIGDEHGRPIKRPALTALVKKAAATAGLSAHCLPHGLRKAILRRLAERGSSSKEIAAVSGHRTLKEIERYTDAADQARLSASAIGKLSEDGGV